ncbi:hypothetical protein GCM10017786_19180 [Amycolatopsis deserti]|uniref:Uncharacterized protein n=1 Tax=Amycolatopsis deserti TaxID=185696 RepID=A0ABQ3IP03_9PSEU|nr:hypothetical protein [Amycolatopsis deserti]GHE87576.1 hypothetical protein GCM10017786_19180 [Amycolatopsis deserti]
MRAEDRTADGLSTDDLVAPRGGEQPAQPMAEQPAGRTMPAEAAATQGVPEESVPAQARLDEGEERVELFRPEQVSEFRDRWREVQTSFVDDPQATLRDADQLVAEVMRALASTFADHKHELESQWQRGEAATEDLRLALRRYRTFFNELLRG